MQRDKILTNVSLTEHGSEEIGSEKGVELMIVW